MPSPTTTTPLTTKPYRLDGFVDFINTESDGFLAEDLLLVFCRFDDVLGVQRSWEQMTTASMSGSPKTSAALVVQREIPKSAATVCATSPMGSAIRKAPTAHPSV